jgi:glycogen synthase
MYIQTAFTPARFLTIQESSRVQNNRTFNPSYKYNFPAAVLYFGNAKPNALQNKVIWLPSVEFDGRDQAVNLCVGGLAVTAKSLSSAYNKYLGADVHMLIPGCSGIDLKRNWKPLLKKNELIQVSLEQEEKAIFQIYQRKYKDPTIGGEIHLYALVDSNQDGTAKHINEHDTYFRQYPNLYFMTDIDPDAQHKKRSRTFLLWNQAVAEALAKLKEKNFLNPDILYMQDFTNALYPDFLKKIQPEILEKTAKVASTHSIEDFKIRIPEHLQSIIKPNLPSGMHSLPGAAMNNADTILVDGPSFVNDFKERYAEEVDGKHPITKNLSDARKVGPFGHHNRFPHYGILSFNPTMPGTPEDTLISKNFSFTPLRNITLSELQPEHLTPEKIKELKAYKAKNKQALYRMVNSLMDEPNFTGFVHGYLRPDEKSKIFLYLHRIQAVKGNHWLLDVMPKILASHPDAQFLISSNSNLSSFPQFATKLNFIISKYPGRVAFINGQPNQKIIYAGSDFGLNLTMEGPYGHAQLEVMRLGTIPIYHNVHGLQSSAGGTGIPIQALSPKERLLYTQYQENQDLSKPNISQKLVKVANTAQNNLEKALETALKLSDEELLILSAKAMHHVAKNHNWKTIIETRFAPVLETALKRRDEKNKPFVCYG